MVLWHMRLAQEIVAKTTCQANWPQWITLIRAGSLKPVLTKCLKLREPGTVTYQEQRRNHFKHQKK
jgi:hypothetical protein